jgi:hypothetical protein
MLNVSQWIHLQLFLVANIEYQLEPPLFRNGYSVLQKSVAKSRPLENAIDSRMRIKTKTYSDLRQKPCQFYWHGLLHITIGLASLPSLTSLSSCSPELLELAASGR